MESSHLRIRKIYIIEFVAIHTDLYLCGYVQILGQGPMAGSLQIYDSIISHLPLELEMTAEIVKIELELPAGTGIIRYFIKYVHLMVYVLYIFERRE